MSAAAGTRPSVSDASRSAFAETFAAAFRQHERFLWGLCYRLCGCAADADDLVQDTFARALERPPADLDAPLRPWLVRVATNLGCDLLRRRKRQPYVGPWLPSPIPTDDDEPSAYEPVLRDDAGHPVTTEGRYDLVESLSFAFLLALEALTPKQRAVLLLRDVFDYDVRETGLALAMREENVKTTHHRARRAMQAYDTARDPRPADRAALASATMQRFLAAVMTGDTAAAEAMLSADVVALSDGGGAFFAARVPVVGRRKVLVFYGNIARSADPGVTSAFVRMNDRLGLRAEIPPSRAGIAPLVTFSGDVDADGRLYRLYSVLAPRKLTAMQAAVDRVSRG